MNRKQRRMTSRRSKPGGRSMVQAERTGPRGERSILRLTVFGTAVMTHEETKESWFFAWGLGERYTVVTAEEWTGPGIAEDEGAFVDAFVSCHPRVVVDRLRMGEEGEVTVDRGLGVLEPVTPEHPFFVEHRKAMNAVSLAYSKAAKHWPEWATRMGVKFGVHQPEKIEA